MSDYDQSSEGPEQNQKEDMYFQVFQHDFYLSTSLETIEQWKQNAKASLNQKNEIEPLKYLQMESSIFDKQQHHLKAAYHIRYYSFAFYLKRAFEQLINQYEKAYTQQKFQVHDVSQIDKKVTELSIYLQKVQLSRAVSYIEQIDDAIIQQIYNLMQTLFPYITQPYCIWRIVMFLEIMNDDKSTHIMNIPFNMSLEYYLKTYKTLKFKHPQLTRIATIVNSDLQKGQYFTAYVNATKQACIFKHKYKANVINQDCYNQSIEESLLCEFLTCLRYMYFATNEKFSIENNLYTEYIFSSLKVPYYGKNENMPTEFYQTLFLRILTKIRQNPELIDLALYIDPNIVGQRSKESFGKLQQVVLNLCRDVANAQQAFLLSKENPEKQYVKILLKDEQYMLLIQFLQTIMAFNKSAFLKADHQIYEIFLDMAQFLKNAFLSFGKDLWLFPQNIFSPLTLGFFKKISEDINDDLKNILYQMVQNLNADKLPQKLVFLNGEFKIVDVSRLEYLSTIMYYIEDCSRQEEYLNLPEIAPANFETSVLLIKSLHVKLKHHEPNPAQMPLFIEYLKECEKYKLNINFNWFKQENYLVKTMERQIQFQIQSGLPCKEIQNHFRRCLNYRDREYARKLIEDDYNTNHLISAVDLASMLKYNHGIQGLSEINGVKEQQIFGLLEEMQTMLAILPDDLFDLPLAEEINVNYLHILLTFYCSKIQQAEGSQIYDMILQKVLLNYLKSPFSRSKQFKIKYPKFFQRFIYQYHQIKICETLNELLRDFQEKQLPFAKHKNEWTLEQRTAVTDLVDKIEIIRDQFLDKLEGSENQIEEFMQSFASLISEGFPFIVFLQCVRLFVKLILKKPSLKQIVSINVFLSEYTYQKPLFFNGMLNYFEDIQSQLTPQKKQVKAFILRHLLKSPEILQVVTFKQLMDILRHARKLMLSDSMTEDFKQTYNSMKKVVVENPQNIKPSWIMAYILLNQYGLQDQYGLSIFDEQPQKTNEQYSHQMKDLLNALKKFESNKDFWEQVRANLKDFKFKEFDFLLEFTYQFSDLMKAKEEPTTFKSVWLYFLKHLGDPSWTFYYMLKLNDPSLINIHENRESLLINLIKKEKLTKESYPIFKSMISETKNMPYILEKIMQSYENEENYVDNFQFHNKLILINERFPDAKIQQCILRWIQVGQNKLPLKIPQSYYINFIKKRLKSLPENVAFESILRIHQSPQEFTKVNKQIERLFQILLYFPVKKFQSVSLSKIVGQNQSLKEEKSEQKIEDREEDEGDEGDWQEEEDQNGDIEIKKTQGKKNSEQQIQNQNDLENSSDEQANQQPNENMQEDENGNSDEDNNYYDDRPEIVEIFYEENQQNELECYKQYCRLRQQIDIYLKSDYEKLNNSPIQDNYYLNTKLLCLIKQLGNLKNQLQTSILMHLPDPLYKALNKLGYNLPKNAEKLQKLRKPKTKIFQIQREMFSDRGESDRSMDNDEEQYSSEDYDDNDDQNDYNEDLGWGNEGQEGPIKIMKKNYNSKKQEDEQDIELPDLNTQFSKVQSQIKGTELDRRELTKILQVFIVQIFKLTPINFKKKQIVYSYVEIMQSDLGQLFFESVLTVLRMDQNHNRNRKSLLEHMKQTLVKIGSKFKLEELSGMPQFSKYNGIVNFVYLLKILKDKGKYNHDQSNPFRKQSGALLPIAQKFIIEFDLPIQTNMFSLVLLYIHSKQKIRELIEEITVTYEGQGVKLTKKQIKRISEAFLNEKTHNSVWEYIESTINYQVKDTQRLIISLDSYSQEVFKALASSGLRVKQTIDKNNEVFNKKIQSQTEIKTGATNHIKHYQRLYYITSNLLNSCSQQIKQFYFMNKHTCRYLWEDDDQNSDNYNYTKVPKKLKKIKDEIYTNQSFVHLLQLAFRIIYFVKKELYGKISSKKFGRLIHYPKMIIETATLYMHLSGQKGTKSNWNFLPRQQVLKIIDNYQMGEKKWTSLSEVYNLILGLLEIQSFCSGKFKQLLIPYFTKNKEIGLDAPLMFKVPEIDDDVNGQNIYITRECSFDMALYQVNGQGLFVEFHGEEGSDHGGLIREFMMGWKGVGVGQEDFFIGKILGISFRQSVPYGGYVDLEMCIKIANYKITMQNIEQIDKEIYSSLKYVKENNSQGLGLTFSIMKKNPKSFEVEEFNLKPNGNQIEVTEENKEEYIKLYLQKYYEAGREHELTQIATGFYTVVCPTYASIFKPHELMQHIKGQQVCDINILRAHVKYIEGYTETSVIIKWLWQILQGYNQEQLNKFIQFLTGSPKLPIFNPNFQITIERVFEVKNLPVAHTCFNTLDLPEYPTKDILQKNLITAIFQGNDNFSIM